MNRASIEVVLRPAAAMFTLLLVLVAAACVGSAANAHAEGKGGSCKVGKLSGYFEAARDGKVRARRASCRAAKSVAKEFARSCAGEYAAQGRCRVKAAGKWRCRSRMLGPRANGTPARVKCGKRKAKLGFVVGYFPPSDVLLDADSRAARRAVSPAWNSGSKCIETGLAGQDVPPPDLANFQVRVVGGEPLAKGVRVQEALIATRAWDVIRTGLNAKPRIDPGRLRIIVTSGTFGSAAGIMAPSCQDDSWDAVLIRGSLNDFELGWVGVHELYHAFSRGLGAAAGTPWQDTWWEEASAAWSQTKAGLTDSLVWDPELQYPNVALDLFDTSGTYHYAMSRFVQFLDSQGMISSGDAWLTQRRVIAKYPDATVELNNALVEQGTDLGEQAAAFWGDRIRESPLHGPQLKVGADGTRQLEIDPLLVEVPIETDRLHTKMIEFTAADDVSRIELEFDEPQDGHFWAAVEPNRSVPISDGQSLAFCVGGGGVDEMPWPDKLPVTFTNGKLLESKLRGTINVSAQRNAEQCDGGASPNNRACRTLADAGVSDLFGPGQFPFYNSSEDPGVRMWLCFYVGDAGEVQHNLVHHRTATARQVREIVKGQIRDLDLREIDGVGDLAGIGTITDDEGRTSDLLVIASGRETVFLLAAPANSERTKRLGKRIVGQIE